MVQGTGSGVGKSVLVAAFCRILRQDGFKVAPFKSQNMALNSYVTEDGGEIGRAQVVQAQAAGIEPTVDMNPILLKPSADRIAQVITLGKPRKNMTVAEYHDYKKEAFGLAKASLERLRSEYDVVVIEGAGSPAEINLQAWDIVNMKISELAGAPVLLVGDIDRGGVFASFVGTLELLPDSDRKRIAGFIINKFRGDIDVLTPGLDFLEERTDLPVLGVLPYFNNIWIEEEDSLGLKNETTNGAQISISVIRLPHISNFTDFDMLQKDANVNLVYAEDAIDLQSSDLIIIPGSKSVIEDLAHLRQTGVAEAILEASEDGIPVIGICGGFQMLGKHISDSGFETQVKMARGLGLLDITTDFKANKVTTRVQAELLGARDFFHGVQDRKIAGYEIHMGESNLGANAEPAFRIVNRNGRQATIHEGAVSKDRPILGTYIHGVFENAHIRRGLINYLLRKKNRDDRQESQVGPSIDEVREQEFDKLADLVRNNLDIRKFYEILRAN